MASKLCDSCQSATATLFCRADSAFLCVNCDSKIHAANKLASRHPRVWLCEVCEQAPAHVTCKADDAALCVTCDRDIHSANPLSSRHDRVPVTPFYDSMNSAADSVPVVKSVVNFLDDRYLSDVDGETEVSREEAEAASWLLPNPKAMENPDLNSGQYLFQEMDPYLDLDYGHVDPKLEEAQEQNSCGADGVVPVQSKNMQPLLVNDQSFELDFSAGSKPFVYGYHHAQCLSQSIIVVDGHQRRAGWQRGDRCCGDIATGGPALVRGSRGEGAEVQREAEEPKVREDDTVRFEKSVRGNSAANQRQVREAHGGGDRSRADVPLRRRSVVLG
ncbi:unnamed protein product [Malus baccata var. baccata]